MGLPKNVDLSKVQVTEIQSFFGRQLVVTIDGCGADIEALSRAFGAALYRNIDRVALAKAIEALAAER